MKKYFAEIIGTFALVFCGTGAIIVNQETAGAVSHVGIAITFGLIVSAMIYAFGDVSGAHLNPAVSIAFWVGGKFPGRSVLPYILSQLAGALIASVVLHFLFPNNHSLGSTHPAGSAVQSFILEMILSYILMLVIVHVSSGSKEKGMFAGLAIGSVVLLEAMFAGPVSGASMNPARSLAPAIISGDLNNVWIYLLGPVTGALAAIFTWKILSEDPNGNKQNV